MKLDVSGVVWVGRKCVEIIVGKNRCDLCGKKFKNVLKHKMMAHKEWYNSKQEVP